MDAGECVGLIACNGAGKRALLLVGLDVIGGHLTEINVTSPTCFQEISAQAGLDVAAQFIDALERRLG